MKIQSVFLTDYTVFAEAKIQFSDGLNILIGENATGKTQLLKLLYSACRSSSAGMDFAYKLVRTMMPDDYCIARLAARRGEGTQTKIKVTASAEDEENSVQLSMQFDAKTKKWNADVSGKEKWEKQFAGVSSVFIPAKEILSHSYKLAAAASVDNVHFDDTYIDIIHSAMIDVNMGRSLETYASFLRSIESLTGGKVVYDDKKDEFYLKSGSSKQEFPLVAEGIKKLGLLWILAKNGALEKGSVLFWDEPEANMNPAFLSAIARLLLELERNGVQIFISTHNYFLAKYIEIYKRESDQVRYYSLYRMTDRKFVQCETGEDFTLLDNNPIVKTYLQIFRDEIGVSL